MNRIPVKIKNMNKKGKKNSTKTNKSPGSSPILAVHKPQPVKKKMMRPAGPIDHSFARALVCPFAEGTLGVKVPDMYAFETNSYHIKTTILTGSITGGLVFFANPFHTMWDLGLQTGGSPSVLGAGGFYSLAATGMYGATTPTLLSGVCSDWRLVSCGIRIRNLQPQLSAAGRLFVATVPTAAGGTPNYSWLNGAAGTATAASAGLRLGLPTTAIMKSPAIQELPSSRDYVVGQLIGDETVYINHQVFHPDFYRFKPSSDSNLGPAGFQEYDEVVVNPATGIVQTTYSGNKEMTQSDGSSAIIMYWEGCPASVSAFEVDVVYHFETTPIVGPQLNTSITGIAPISDSTAKVYQGTTSLLETSINVANQADNIICLASEARNTLKEFDKSLGGIPSALAKSALSVVPFGKKISKFFGL